MNAKTGASAADDGRELDAISQARPLISQEERRSRRRNSAHFQGDE